MRSGRYVLASTAVFVGLWCAAYLSLTAYWP